jgi:hypothetical protein
LVLDDTLGLHWGIVPAREATMTKVRTNAIKTESKKDETLEPAKPATTSLKVKTGMRAGDDWEARV